MSSSGCGHYLRLAEEELMTADLAALGAEPVLRNTLIAAHASCAAAAFLLGAVLAVRRRTRLAQGWAYVIALMLMTLFVSGAVILDWNGLDPAIRGLFAALIALAGYTTWRGWRARARLGTLAPRLPTAGPALACAIDDLGFTLITLFTGFVVILANQFGSPIWLMVVLGVFSVVTGRSLVTRVKARRLQPAKQRRHVAQADALGPREATREGGASNDRGLPSPDPTDRKSPGQSDNTSVRNW
jgi:hypothetical protein